MTTASPTPPAGAALALALLAGAAGGQEGPPVGDPGPREDRPAEDALAYEPAPPRELEIAVSDESVHAGLSFPLGRVEGAVSLGFLANEDDDFLLDVALSRTGRPTADERLELGVGVGFYALFPDVPRDDEAFALTLEGSAGYDLGTEIPTSLRAELAYGPPVTTFGDGEDLVDLRLGVDVEVGSHAAAFAGYRFVQLDLESSGHRELDDRLHVGVRLGF